MPILKSRPSLFYLHVCLRHMDNITFRKTVQKCLVHVINAFEIKYHYNGFKVKACSSIYRKKSFPGKQIDTKILHGI